MTDYGLTAAGWVSKTFTEILAQIETRHRERIWEGLDQSENTALGNMNATFALEAADLWEALTAVAGGLDPDTAPEVLLTGLAKLTGVTRRGVTYGEASCNMKFTHVFQIPAGGVTVARSDDSTSLWRNVYEIVVPASRTLSGVLFRSVEAGAGASAPAGTLTVPSPPVSGVTEITNPADATPGTDVESADELRLRREQSVARAGSASTAAIKAEILSGGDDGTGVAGVVDCRVIENDTDVTSPEGIPAKRVMVLIWDGETPAASNTEIAEAILRKKGAGCGTYGATSVSAEDPDGNLKTVYFQRMTGVDISIVVTVAGDTSATAIKDAIVAYGEGLPQGDAIIYTKLLGAIVDVAGVTDVTALTIQKDADPPVSANVAVDFDEKTLWDPADITVSIT